MGWVGHVAHIGGDEDAYKIVFQKLKGNRLRYIWEIKMKMDLGERRCWQDSTDSGQSPIIGFCEHNNETSGAEFFGQVSNYQLFNNDFIPLN